MKCAHYAFVNIIAVTVATNQTNFVTPAQTTDTTGQAGESLTRQNGKAFLESLYLKWKTEQKWALKGNQKKKPYSNFWTGLLRVWPSYCFHFIRSFHRLFFWAWNEIRWPCNNRTATQWIQRNYLVLALIYQPVTEVRPSEQLWDGSRRVGSSDRKETRETKWNNIADVHWYYWHMHLTGVYL